MEDDFSPQAEAPEADPVAEAKNAALGQMAKSEDISDFAAERRAQERDDAGDGTVTEDRAARVRQALEQVQRDTAKARQEAGLDEQPYQDSDGQYWDAEEQWQEQAQAESEQRAVEEAEVHFTARAELLREQNPAVWQQISNTMAMFDQVGLTEEQLAAVKRGITMSGGKDGLDIGYRLSLPSQLPDGSVNYPEDKIRHIASLPPEQILQTFRDARIYLQAENETARHFAAQGRRVSKAPPPINTPRGSSSAPRDLASLASRERVDDYVKFRRQQEKKAER
jgi:hypothetical protein